MLYYKLLTGSEGLPVFYLSVQSNRNLEVVGNPLIRFPHYEDYVTLQVLAMGEKHVDNN